MGWKQCFPGPWAAFGLLECVINGAVTAAPLYPLSLQSRLIAPWDLGLVRKVFFGSFGSQQPSFPYSDGVFNMQQPQFLTPLSSHLVSLSCGHRTIDCISPLCFLCVLPMAPACEFLINTSFSFVSFLFPVELSLLRFLSAELTRGYFLEHNEAKYTERRERVYTCMRIPRELEKVLFFFFHFRTSFESVNYEKTCEQLPMTF